MIRRYSFFRRRPDLDPAAFSAYYEQQHGRMIAGLPAFWRYAECYVQNHVLPPMATVTGPHADWDGITEVWQVDGVTPERSFSDDDSYRRYVAPDEPNFITVESKLRLAAEPKIVVDGPAAKVKLLTLIRRRPGMSGDEFQAAWAHHAEVAKNVPEFQRYVRRYVQNYVIPTTVSSADGHPGYDGIVELGYDTIEDALAMYAAPRFSATLQTDERTFVTDHGGRFLVREVLIPPAPQG